MASGDLTASEPLHADIGMIDNMINSLNLAAATDHIMVVPVPGRDQQFIVFKVEREAD